MLGIPYRVHQLQRIGQNGAGVSTRPRTAPNSGSSRSAAEFRLFLTESGIGHPILMQRMTGWTFGSKVMAATAGFILVSGIILTLMTMNSSWLQLDAYRPIIFTILGILFIIIGPMVVCRMVLNAYDRRLAREQRQFEQFAQRIRQREFQDAEMESIGDRAEASRLTTPQSRARLAVDYLLDVAGVSGRRVTRTRADRAELLFPGKLPSYESALDLDNAHWSTKFFDYQRDPPPAYQDVCIEMEMIPVHRRRNMDQDDVSSLPPAYPLIPENQPPSGSDSHEGNDESSSLIHTNSEDDPEENLSVPVSRTEAHDTSHETHCENSN